MSELINCHTHIFNIKNAPERFLQGFTKKLVSDIAWPVLNTSLGSIFLIRMIRLLARDPHTRKLASFLKVGTMKSQNDIFKDLKKNYPSGNKFVVLTLNMDHMGAGQAEYGYREQLHDIKRIKAQNADTCLPFYSVDPRAGTAEQILEETVDHITNKGFAGIKIYPALGFYPFAPNLMKVFKWAGDNNVPVMTHCTRVGSYYLGEITEEMKNPSSFQDRDNISNWPEKFGKVEFPITRDLNTNEKFCDNFSEIYNYAVALHKFKNLKLCFAHAGGVDEIDVKDTEEARNKAWFTQIQHLMREYDNVYTDISYTLYNKKVFPHFLKLIRDEQIGNKVLFGTDYFMTLQESMETFLVSKFRAYLEAHSAGEDLWKKITVDNPKAYLTSNFYVA